MKTIGKSGETDSGNFLKKRAESFKNAFSGLGILFRFEYNARIHLAALVLVILAGILLGISAAEWLFIAFAAGMVLMAECFNSALEHLSDEVSPGYSKRIKRAKDVAAAGVLISAIVALTVGIIIFLPRILSLFSK